MVRLTILSLCALIACASVLSASAGQTGDITLVSDGLTSTASGWDAGTATVIVQELHEVKMPAVDPQLTCILGNAPVICPYQCSNGIDDDGDGATDYPSDPGCSSPDDDQEYTSPPACYAPAGVRHSFVETKYGPWGTSVELFGYYYDVAPNCPWAPAFYDGRAFCGVDNGWRLDSCAWGTVTSRHLEVRATFSCTSSTCAGATSPHSLTTGIDINPPGWACTNTFPVAAYPNNYGTHCHQH